MKCIYCGEDLKDGSLFCSKCGKEVQMVPDYNLFDDDYLKQVLAEENASAGNENPNPNTVRKQPGNPKEQKKKQMKIIAGVIGIVCVLIFALLVLGAAIKSNHDNSYEYQIGLAEKAYKAGDTEEAIAYYQKALTLNKDSIEARLALADIYMEEEDYDSALVLYQEVIRMDKKNKDACKKLIAIYDEQENKDAIVALSEAVDESLKDLFADYIIVAPNFSMEPGTYEEVQTLMLSSADGYSIFYTLDGSDPITRGVMYTTPIALDENNKTYQIQAVCMNKKGYYSDVVTKEYTIEIPAPDMPIVTPDGGDFGVETTVTVTVPEGCSAYYTWDGSTPNAQSNLYTQPITVPEGNNVLAVVIIDNATNLVSDVYKGNFVYYAPDYEEDMEE